MKRHAAILARLLTAICPIILLTSPMANAQPPGDPGVSSESTLPLVQLGGRPHLAFYGIQGTQTVTFPVSQGLEPVALNAFTQLPVNVRTATVTAVQDGRTIGRVDVAPGAPAPIAIPLDRADVVDNAVTVTLRTYLLPMEGYCLDPTNALELSDPSVTFAGAEQTPSTVADFLTPVLRQLTIFVDEQPSPSESDAVVQLATAVASRYGAQNPTVTVAPLANGQTGPTEPSGPLARHVVVAEGDDVACERSLVAGHRRGPRPACRRPRRRVDQSGPTADRRPGPARAFSEGCCRAGGFEYSVAGGQDDIAWSRSAW
ncbi:hypothetical protein ACTWP6_15060 [Mycobacterium sp. 4D054]|uniref:hypothetical protein n=1 Tax=Mycobacterium sp. 4D054 TaxID=3457440 RepID=UPI003FD119DF